MIVDMNGTRNGVNLNICEPSTTGEAMSIMNMAGIGNQAVAVRVPNGGHPYWMARQINTGDVEVFELGELHRALDFAAGV